MGGICGGRMEMIRKGSASAVTDASQIPAVVEACFPAENT